ncbi:MAG: hypothetical protein U0804_09020 [Gemmataceae bacterium]
MRFPLGEMTVGDILDRGLKLLFARLPAFYALYLFMLSPVILLQLVIPFLLEAMINDLNAAGAGQGGAAFDPTNLILFFAAYLLALVLTVVLVTIGNAAVLHIIMEEYQGNRVGVGAALGYALGRFFPLLGVSLLFGLMVGVGILFCCVPGFYLLATYMFVTQVVVLERRGVGESLTRSAELADGYRWRVLGVYLLVTLVSGFAQGFVVQVLGFVLPGQEMIPGAGGRMQIKVNVVNSIIDTLVGNLVSIVFSAYLAVCVTLLYLDLRIRKEGFDLELAALRGEEGEFDPPPRRRRRRDEDDDYDDDRRRRRRDEDDDYDDDRDRR